MTKDLQENCEYHRALSKYFCLHFLIDLIFVLQIIYFCSGCLSSSYEICIHTDDNAKGFISSISSAAKRGQNQHGHPAQHQDAVRNSSMLRNNYENGVIVFYVTRSFRMYFSDFCLQKRPIPHVDKILNPKLGAVSSCAAC